MCTFQQFIHRCMNRRFYIFYCFFFLQACVYDAPLKGKTIYFINQDENYVFVCDTLDDLGYLKIYDTILVNDESQIRSRGNFLPKYSLWEDLLSNIEIDSLKKRRSDKIKYLFIRNDHISLPKSTILDQKLYDSIEVDLKEILDNQLNYFVYHKDSIVLLHTYDVSFKRK